MIIPEQIKRSHIVEIPKKHAVIMFAKRRYGFNILNYTQEKLADEILIRLL